jgi:signal transduction histidine kinase
MPFSMTSNQHMSRANPNDQVRRVISGDIIRFANSCTWVRFGSRCCRLGLLVFGGVTFLRIRGARRWSVVCLLVGLHAIDARPEVLTDTRTLMGSYELRELRHTAFRPEDGAPSDITAMAQTTDGFLWIATPTGLFRYDGARFDMELSNRLPSSSVGALLAEPDGSLWIGYTFGGVSVLRTGELLNVSEGRLPLGSVTQFFRSPDGVLWVATNTGLGRLAGDQWQRVDDHMDYSGERPEWLGSSGSRLFVVTATATFWYSAESGHFVRRARIEGQRIRLGSPRHSDWLPDFLNDFIHWPNLAVVDRAGSLWAPALRGEELLRYRWLLGSDAPTEDRFSPETGLTGTVTSIFEDREGNVWVGTEKGLDRFSIPKLRRIAVPGGAERPLLIPGDHGDVWVGRSRDPIVHAAPSGRSIPALGNSVVAAFRAQDGSLWVAGKDGILQYANDAIIKRLPFPVSEAQFPELLADLSSIQALAVDADDAVWLSIAQAGLYRWSGRGWTKAEQHYRLPQGAAVRLTVDGRRRLWIGYPGNQLAVIEGDQSIVFTATDGLNVGNVLALDVEDTHAWIAGDRGVAALIGTRFVPVRGVGDVDFRLVSGVVETAEGDLWLNGPQGLYRIPSANIRSVLSGTNPLVDFELFDWRDGLDSPAELPRPGPTMMRAADGHLWISRSEGVWTIDPAHIFRNPVVPIASIEDLICNGIRYNTGSGMNLSSGSRNLQIDYTAALLAHPERVRFRYRLLGVDQGWQDAGQRRQAYYTNLGPGAYEFQLIAANEDGVWSTTNAVLSFNVRPAFYQRLSVKIAGGVLALLILALVFVVRLEHLHKRYRRGIEARHAERERIARDMHDTLLQGVQALLFRLQMWEEDRNIPALQRSEIAAVSLQTKSIILKSRERILMIRRTDAQPADLVESLAAIGNESPLGTTPAFEVKTVGSPETLTIDAKEQLLDIAREAVRNACQHARATRVEVTVDYRKRSLIMRITDDGQGFDASVTEGRTESIHFGLMGMRERAKQLKAEFHIQSKAGSGTRIDVIVPARAAFRDAFQRTWHKTTGPA